MNDGTLFEQVAGPTSSAAPWVVITNRSNVLEWLSSSLTLPRAAYSKYYTDTLEFLAEAVPAVAAPIGPELVQHAESEGGNFCVLVEVRPEAVSVLDNERIGILVPTTLDVVQAIHVTREEHRREFLARSFDNLEIDRIDVSVSPQLFSDTDEVVVSDVRAAVSDAAVSEAGTPWTLVDRLGGARALGIQALVGDPTHVRAVLSVMLGEPAKRSRRKPKETLDWLALTPALRDYAPKKSLVFDERLFLAAASVLLGADRQDAVDPGAVLSRIDDLLQNDSSISGADLERWGKARGRTADVFAGDVAFTRFNSGEARTEKALFLALVRSGPQDVLSWGDEDVGAHPDDLLLAAIFVGLSSGRKTLPWDLRPASLDNALAARELADCGLPASQAKVEVTESDGLVVVNVDGLTVRTLTPPPKPVTELLEELDPTDPDVAQALLEFCRRHDLGEAVTTTVSLKGPLQVTSRRGGMEVESAGFPSIESRVDVKTLGRSVVEAPPEVVGAFREILERGSTQVGV